MAAAGSSVVTEILHRPIKKIKYAWTSDASGNVSGGAAITTSNVLSGKIVGIVTVPAAAGNAPTAYTLTIKDADGVDVLLGAGTARSTSAQEAIQGTSLGWVCESTLELAIASAGNAKQGTVYLYIQ